MLYSRFATSAPRNLWEPFGRLVQTHFPRDLMSSEDQRNEGFKERNNDKGMDRFRVLEKLRLGEQGDERESLEFLEPDLHGENLGSLFEMRDRIEACLGDMAKKERFLWGSNVRICCLMWDVEN